MGRLRMVYAAAGGLAVLVSCAPPAGRDGAAARRRPPVRAEQPGVAARAGEHWVQSDRLRAVMGQVSGNAARWPAGVPEDSQSPQSERARAEAEDAFRDAAAIAQGLSDAAARIPRSVADHPMSAEDRRGFAAEARRLQNEAKELGRAARERRVGPMRRSFDRISAACTSCHSQYKDYAGELENRRADDGSAPFRVAWTPGLTRRAAQAPETDPD